MRERVCSFLIVLILLIVMIPPTSSSATGINFLVATQSQAPSAFTSSVDINNENTIIASSYGDVVELHNSTSGLIIKSWSFGNEVYDIDFSPNGELLAVSVQALDASSDSIQLIDVENQQILTPKGSGNSKKSNIDWSPNGTYIISPNMYNGATIYDSRNMNSVQTLNGEHLSDITCVRYSSNGEKIITADEDGVVKLWSSDGVYQGIEVNVGNEVTGCDFSSSDIRFAIVTQNGLVETFSLEGSDLQTVELDDTQEIKWSLNSDILYVLESENSPKLISLDGSTFSVISSVMFMHKSSDFAIVEDGNQIENLYIATDTKHIAIYGTPSHPEGYGEQGSDLDGDGIPDRIDEDDDGDSFIDDWDFNCPEEIECERVPDLSTIREYILSIEGDSLIVEDIYTLNMQDTYIFRNLTRRSIIADQQISYQESNLFEESICFNMDTNDYISRLRNSIDLSVGQVDNGTTKCSAISGLALTNTFDLDPIKLSFKTTFDIIPNATYPFTLSLSEQISISDSSITHLVENHPVLIQSIDYDGNQVYDLWWNYDNTPAINFTLSEEDEGFLTSLTNGIKDNILLSTGIILALIFTVWAIIRKQNKDSLILNEEDFEPDIEDIEFEDLDNASSTQISKPKSLTIQEIALEESDDIELNADVIPAEESPIERRAFRLDEDDELTITRKEIKRRTGKLQRNTHGPIMSTKRKRLDGKLDIPGEKIITKKKAVQVKGRKVRKVRQKKDPGY